MHLQYIEVHNILFAEMMHTFALIFSLYRLSYNVKSVFFLFILHYLLFLTNKNLKIFMVHTFLKSERYSIINNIHIHMENNKSIKALVGAKSFLLTFSKEVANKLNIENQEWLVFEIRNKELIIKKKTDVKRSLKANDMKEEEEIGIAVA
jgi:hypothetical protein